MGVIYMHIDYYKLLGVSRHSTEEEIRIAYHELVKRIHPDKFSPNTEEWTNGNRVLCKANKAYSVLRDTHKRRNYDAMLWDDSQNEAQQTTQTSPSSANSETIQNPTDPNFHYDPREWVDGSGIKGNDHKGFIRATIGFIADIIDLIFYIFYYMFLMPIMERKIYINSYERHESWKANMKKQNKEWITWIIEIPVVIIIISAAVCIFVGYLKPTAVRASSIRNSSGSIPAHVQELAKSPIYTQTPLKTVSKKQEIASWSIPAQTPPKSARYSNAIGRKGEAPFEINTSETGYYFIKLVEIGTNKAVKIFVHAGKPLEVEIPLGKYEMKYAYGKTWYGEEYLFGPETVYTKSDSIFDFEKRGNRISGYTVTLYKVRDGNMQTHEITAADF